MGKASGQCFGNRKKIPVPAGAESEDYAGAVSYTHLIEEVQAPSSYVVAGFENALVSVSYTHLSGKTEICSTDPW